MTRINAWRYGRRAEVPSFPQARSPLALLLHKMGKLAIVVSFAAAVIIGILAMHLFASPASHGDMGMSVEVSTASMDANHATAGSFDHSVIPIAECLTCGEESSAELMWCVLALLTTALLLAAPRMLRGWGHYIEQQLIVGAVLSRDTGVIPRPPNITTLCISRT